MGDWGGQPKSCPPTLCYLVEVTVDYTGRKTWDYCSSQVGWLIPCSSSGKIQAKHHTKEKACEQDNENKILGLKGAVVWTEPEIVEGLCTNQTIQDGKKEAAEKQSKEKQLKVEAEEWKKSAQQCQEHAHQALLSNWALSPRGRKPWKLRLEAIPEI